MLLIEGVMKIITVPYTEPYLSHLFSTGKHIFTISVLAKPLIHLSDFLKMPIARHLPYSRQRLRGFPILERQEGILCY